MIKMPAGFGVAGLGNEATLQYSDSDYRIIRQGTFVRCGVTGAPIPIDDLRYWSAERQEAYASPEAILQRLRAESTAR